jgi:Kdo2-lipid IVA lauroyltransferase/acyltransferase
VASSYWAAGGLYRLAYWLARALLASLEYAPLPVADALSRVYVKVLDLAVPRLRRTARCNLELANMPGGDRLIDGVFRSIARIFVALARFPKLKSANVSDWIRYEGLEHFEEARQIGRGVLFATAHLGNWELSAFAHGLMTAPMNIVVRPLDHPLIDKFVEKRRMLSGNRVIGKKDAARAILRALRANKAVGILVDQNVTASEGVFVDFFGVPACAGSALVKLAHHSGAVVIPGFALWSESDRRYTLRFYEPLKLTGSVQADTAQLHARIEAVIRDYPDQWMWVHRRWKTRPPGEPPLY